jgi:phosphoribosylaminoimidazole-succinocarboxamide synthase
VVVRNIAAGSLCKQTGLPLGTVLKHPLVEFFYKKDELGDPLLTRDRLLLLELATPEQVDGLKTMALQVNEILGEFFHKCGMTLVDFKLEFGLDANGTLLLADEISPDTCRLWDEGETDRKKRVMDKDRFRQDLGKVEEAYQKVLERVLNSKAQA